MTDPILHDALWHAAVGWVMREHESPLDDGAHAALLDWLAHASAHRAAYDKASLLWLLTGLVPPTGMNAPSSQSS